MKPILCNYYVTYRCNAACGFCDIWEQPSPMVTLDDARRNHVASAVAGAALLPLVVAGVPLALLAATALGAVLGAIGSYRLRLRGVERRIMRMLDTVAAPSA